MTEPPAKKDCQFGLNGLCQREPKSAWTLQETHHNSTSYARDEARTYARDETRTSERVFDRQMP